MPRPRLLLVPTVCELEWRIRPQLEEWAEVASYDAPGVGEEPAAASPSIEAIVDRGLAELERLGWDRYLVVGDEFGGVIAARIAAARRERVEALALGHACLSLRSDGQRPPINAEVRDAFMKLARTDYGSYVRALGQITQHAYDDEWVEGYRERVTPEAALAYETARFDAVQERSQSDLISSLEVPLLFVEHKGCLLFTREGFEDAAAAFPEAETASTEIKPSADPRFSELLREFCARLPSATSARAD